MARIRTIKPEFFRSRSLSRCSRDARLTFQGLWAEADDAGRGIADSRLLKGAIWPLDDDLTHEDVEKHLHELLDTGHIALYEVDGERYYLVLSFTKHQASAYRRSDPVHPAPPVTTTHEDACNNVLEGKGREGNREGEGDGADAPPAPPVGFAASLVDLWRSHTTPPRAVKDRNRAIGTVQQFIDLGHAPAILEAAVLDAVALTEASLQFGIDKALKAKPQSHRPGKQITEFELHRRQLLDERLIAVRSNDTEDVDRIDREIAELVAKAS